MSFDTLASQLPRDIENLVKQTLDHEGIPTTDFHATSVLIQALLIDRLKKKLWILLPVFGGVSLVITLISSIGAFNLGRSQVYEEMTKPRPLIVENNPGVSLIYGNVGTLRVVGVKPVDGVMQPPWESHGTWFFTFKPSETMSQ